MKKVLALALTTVFASSAFGAVVFSDDFDTYADTTAMNVEWGTTAGGSLDTAYGNGGNSIMHTGGTQNTDTFAAINQDDGTIIWEFDLGLQNVANLGNGRVTATLDKVTFGWLEFGVYNDLENPNDLAGANVDGFGMRILANGGEGWRAFPSLPVLRTGWHHMKATIDADQIVFEAWLDAGFDAGGSPVAAEHVSYTSTAHAGGGLLWDEVKIGGPSALPSGNTAWFDNMTVSQVPEPTSLALLALCGVMAARRRR